MEDIIIAKAKKWAKNAWSNSVNSWIDRTSQDFSYREIVVHPPLTELIKRLGISTSSSLVEIGCGDGSHAIFWRQTLNSMGLTNAQIFGIDILETSIQKARENALSYKNMSFDVADVSSIDTARLIYERIGEPYLVVAMFLLQDVADLEGVLKLVTTCLPKGGHFITVFIHPNFARHLYEADYIKKCADKNLPTEYITNRGIVQWRFMGYYPIVQKNCPPFYLPYFHRELGDYMRAFQEYGLNITHKEPLMLNPSLAEKLKEEKITPFYKNKYNVYWPLIVKEPSSILIHAVKNAKE